MHPAQCDAGDQSHRPWTREDLQLQCGCRRGQNGGCVEGAPPGFHERCAWIVAQPARPEIAREPSKCRRSASVKKIGGGRCRNDSEGGQRRRSDRERCGESAICRRTNPAFGFAGNFYRRGRGNGGGFVIKTENVQRSTSNIQRSTRKDVRETFDKFVVPSYARFDLVLDRGEGSWVWDVNGRRYLDLAGGIAVCSVGHAHPQITAALTEQSRKLVHVSNLYYNELQGRLAERIMELIEPGRVFFCNSGAEANEGLFKLARKFGHQEAAVSKPPARSGNRPPLVWERYEIITAFQSFHGRTLAGIAAT